ncbi:hypothetical protein PFISCL1PPCAC_25821, partial [Pristionchus fissidentatus]
RGQVGPLGPRLARLLIPPCCTSATADSVRGLRPLPTRLAPDREAGRDARGGSPGILNIFDDEWKGIDGGRGRGGKDL